MAPKYEREQAALQGQREELAAEISKSDKVYENIEQFLSLIWKYTGITELTPCILNELIERIVVHEKAVGPDGVKTQQVDIYYKFVGCINQRRNGGCTGEVIKADKAQPEADRHKENGVSAFAGTPFSSIWSFTLTRNHRSPVRIQPQAPKIKPPGRVVLFLDWLYWLRLGRFFRRHLHRRHPCRRRPCCRRLCRRRLFVLYFCHNRYAHRLRGRHEFIQL